MFENLKKNCTNSGLVQSGFSGVFVLFFNENTKMNMAAFLWPNTLHLKVNDTS